MGMVKSKSPKEYKNIGAKICNCVVLFKGKFCAPTREKL